ncbi:TerB family tellurite resistance protein [Methyloceanibacter sp. wino2]|uniref:TerB family tellurite resistance protein n=1 Tax=Methyloceanibacter sp. wino2 TaxID=2170729 RepID=UPI000D3ED9A6|nr:TerB family tellurite resistance protein [Methyloceanibacter sp. wino2]
MTTAMEADWVLRTMAAMAAADQRLDAREVDLIQRVYQELTGRPVDVGGVVSAVQVYARRDVAEDLSRVAGSFSPEAKTAIMHGAYRTLAVNNHISQAERDTLGRVAGALRLTESELEAILAEVDTPRSPT